MTGTFSGPPTREHLLAVRKRILSVTHGKKLLERKRDALVRAMDEERRLFREAEKEFRERTKKITFLYTVVRMFEGEGALHFLSAGNPPLSVDVVKKSIMGCRYAGFFPEEGQLSGLSWKLPFDPAVTSLSLEDLLKAMEESEKSMWRYINLKAKVGAIERELAKTTLRINTLEHVFLPSLHSESRRIEDLLSERERQEKYVAKRAGKKKTGISAGNRENILDTAYENHYP